MLDFAATVVLAMLVVPPSLLTPAVAGFLAPSPEVAAFLAAVVVLATPGFLAPLAVVPPALTPAGFLATAVPAVFAAAILGRLEAGGAKVSF